MRYRGSVTLTLPIEAELEPVHTIDLGLVIGPIRDRPRPHNSQGETPMATTLQLTDIQEVVLSINPLDEEKAPAQLDGPPTWASSDDTIITVTPATDGLSATATTVGPIGTATVTVTGQGDLTGGGSDPVDDTVTIQVMASKASALNITAGTPTQRAGT